MIEAGQRPALLAPLPDGRGSENACHATRTIRVDDALTALLDSGALARGLIGGRWVGVFPDGLVRVDPLLAGDATALVEIDKDDQVLVGPLVDPLVPEPVIGIPDQLDHLALRRVILSNLGESIVHQLVPAAGQHKHSHEDHCNGKPSNTRKSHERGYSVTYETQVLRTHRITMRRAGPCSPGQAVVDNAFIRQMFAERRVVRNQKHELIAGRDHAGIHPKPKLVHLCDLVPEGPLLLHRREVDAPMIQAAAFVVPTCGNVLKELNSHPTHDGPRVVEKIDSLEQKLDTIGCGVVVEALDPCKGLDDLDAAGHEQGNRLLAGGFIRRHRSRRTTDKREQERAASMDKSRPDHVYRRLSIIGRSPSNRMGRVYRRGSRPVNPHKRMVRPSRFSVVPMVAMIAAGLATPGCTVRSTSGKPVFDRTYQIMAAYDVEPMFVSQARSEGIGAIRRDFHKAAELGFNGVLLRHVFEDDCTALLDVAGEAGLHAAITSQSLQHFIGTGILPNGRRTEGDLVRAAGMPIASRRDPPSIALECGIGRRESERCDGLRGIIVDVGWQTVVAARGDAQSGVDSLAVIDVGVGGSDRQESPLEPWLAQYHLGLSGGRTSGIVFYRYRRIPGDPPGLQPAREPPAPARTSAVKELITRAQLWGPRLIGADTVPITGSTVDDRDLSLTGFIRGGRRYLMVFNRSEEHYTRGQVVLPDAIGGVAVTRAVEVPASKLEPAGRVHHPGRGRIELSVALRPGDAALFELF